MTRRRVGRAPNKDSRAEFFGPIFAVRYLDCLGIDRPVPEYFLSGPMGTAKRFRAVATHFANPAGRFANSNTGIRLPDRGDLGVRGLESGAFGRSKWDARVVLPYFV